jgi:hypothetical protein
MGSIQISTGFFDPSIVNPAAYCSLNERMRCRRAGEELSNVDCCPVESQIAMNVSEQIPVWPPYGGLGPSLFVYVLCGHKRTSYFRAHFYFLSRCILWNMTISAF